MGSGLATIAAPPRPAALHGFPQPLVAMKKLAPLRNDVQETIVFLFGGPSEEWAFGPEDAGRC